MISRPKVTQLHSFDDFTEEAYRTLIRLARNRFSFARFGELQNEPHVIWRHDLDYSVQRAVRLAEIESEEGVRATYLVLLRGAAYNPFSRPVSNMLRQIVELGHDIGLHFDSTYYGEVLDSGALSAAIKTESGMLADIVGINPRALSFHLYGNLQDLPKDDKFAGLVNAYGRTMLEKYQYVSDSNGIWRHRSIREVLESDGVERLQVLTHPEWWVPVAKAPWVRLSNAIEEYGRMVVEEYDAIVASSGRPNIR